MRNTSNCELPFGGAPKNSTHTDRPAHQNSVYFCGSSWIWTASTNVKLTSPHLRSVPPIERNISQTIRWIYTARATSLRRDIVFESRCRAHFLLQFDVVGFSCSPRLV